MKRTITLGLLVGALALTACNSKQKEENVDSLQNAAADSLLNSALADTATVDSAHVDTTKSK